MYQFISFAKNLLNSEAPKIMTMPIMNKIIHIFLLVILKPSFDFSKFKFVCRCHFLWLEQLYHIPYRKYIFLSFGLSFIFQFSHTVPHTRGLPLVRAARATWGRKLRRGFFTFAIVRFLYHHLFKGIVGKQGHRASSSVSSSLETSPVSASGSSSS